MAQQIINVGAAPNDGDGDPLRTAFQKTNSNFTELYGRAQTTPPASLIGEPGDEAGDYAYNENFFYYCFANYDGSSVIWAQVTQVGNISTNQLNSGNSNVIISGAGGPVIISTGGVSNVAVFDSSAANIVGNVVSGGFFLGNGSLLSGLPQSYANANVTAYAESGWAGNIVPAANATYSLGSFSNQYKDLFLSNSTLYLGNVQITSNGTQVLVGGNTVITANAPVTGNVTVVGNISANAVIGNTVVGNTMSATGNINIANVNATGNITASYLYGNGAFLTGVVTANGFIGATGPIGPIGATGPQGPSGPSGPTGPQGPRGPQGFIGQPGATGSGATGATGFQGATGITGATGAIGNILTDDVDGDGFSVTNINNFSANVITANVEITATGNISGAYFLGNGSLLDGLSSFTGATGPEGATGPQGATGPDGATGPEGATGPTGPQGATGPEGATGLTGATGVFGGTLTANIDGNNYSISNVSLFAGGNANIINDISASGNVTANNTLIFGNVEVLGGDPLAATDTTITFKIPVTINGNVYYIALTTAQ
jgi:hypothetical protein